MMKGLSLILLFTAMTFLAWGSYGPALHHGSMLLEHDSLRAFVGVGLAYFLVGVIMPFAILLKSGEKGNWTTKGAIFSLIAGAVGAIGALGVTTALGNGGSPVYVMPLVFGFAPIVNTLVTAAMSKTFNQISLIFVAGVVTAALGAGGVLFFKPTPTKAPAAEIGAAMDGEIEPGEVEAITSAGKESVTEDMKTEGPAETTDDESAESDAEEGDTEEASSDESEVTVTTSAGETQTPKDDAAPAGKTRAPANVPAIIISIVVAALCWGSYGSMLHIGQGKMNGSRLRPFACVGISYFIIAVAAPLILISLRTNDAGAWTANGMSWSFGAGIAGAIGALGIVLAFNAGGKPYYVMPLVFGFAPVINTFITLTETGTWSLAEPRFWLSLAVVIAGAVTVLTNAPRPKPKKDLAPST